MNDAGIISAIKELGKKIDRLATVVERGIRMINKTATVHIEVNGIEELSKNLEKMSALAVELKALIEETNKIKLTATGQVLNDE